MSFPVNRLQLLLACWCFIGKAQVENNSIETQLSVLAFNIQMLPTTISDNNQQHRIKHIAPNMLPYDVVVFSEAFDDQLRKDLAAQMLSVFAYSTCILGRGQNCEVGDM